MTAEIPLPHRIGVAVQALRLEYSMGSCLMIFDTFNEGLIAPWVRGAEQNQEDFHAIFDRNNLGGQKHTMIHDT